MKLIVVEDEKIIRTGLLKHVPWQRLGVSEVEELYTGRFDFGLLFIAWKKRQLSERHLIVLSSGKGSGKSSFVAWMGKKCLLR